MAKILISGKIPTIGYQMLEGHDIEIYESDEVITSEELARRIVDKDALLCPLSSPVTKEVIENAGNLKIIANFGAGFDNINLAAAKERSIVVTNTPAVSTDATAELTLGILIAISRRIVEGDALCRTVGFKGWAPLFFLGRELTNKKLGIIGLGKIGQGVAKRARAFGMEIFYTGPRRKNPQIEQELQATYVSMDELLRESDYITIHSPYRAETHHLIKAEQFEQMKQDAFLINASRGPVVKEDDLVQALKAKTIAGAALDVFEFEPTITEELKQLDNVVLTPHIGNATVETRDAMAEIAVKNIVNVLEGKGAITPVSI
ncbi:2-hydroxyacid dehydrogenase family protein [Bacillus sp. PS06]|uniref:2-hydroxyacid dehydrogenase family protein n=1 Tax=Bacillus sp. PS06 TaxID=2764176 RepID=UPI00177D5C9D|nr:2-hydroxyacid dehydrogenase family protein [Bacillus sp. PS06]MBD8068528.1 2-hydroxyacid dehydrogenase family protein [Bacillus sp. PS06]